MRLAKVVEDSGLGDGHGLRALGLEALELFVEGCFFRHLVLLLRHNTPDSLPLYLAGIHVPNL